MRTEPAETESSIAKRTRRACVESMVVHPHGGGSGMFDVFNEAGKRYVVDLRDGVCECPDHEHREANCKHQRRVRLEFGIMDVPAAIRDEHASLTDVELARKRRGIDVEPEPEPVEEHEPITVSDAKPSRRVMADGGRLLEAKPQGSGCDHPDCQHGMDVERPVLCWDHWEARQEARR